MLLIAAQIILLVFGGLALMGAVAQKDLTYAGIGATCFILMAILPRLVG